VNPIEKRGRIYLTLFIAALVLFDLLIKGLLLAAGSLRWSQAVGTLITLVTCWFLWRGSRGAYWFLMVCLIVAAIYAFVMFFKTSVVAVAFIGVFVAILVLALSAPATRQFAVHQRAARA
jgi:hypothetical protein